MSPLPLAGRTAAVLLGWCLAVLVGLNLLPDRNPVVDPALRHARLTLFEGWQGHDSWRPMIIAYAQAVQPGTTPLYTTVFFDREVRFQYPPTALLTFPALAAVGIAEPDWRAALRHISTVAFLVYALTVAALLAVLFAHRGAGWRAGLPAAAAAAVAGLVAAATWFPATKALSNGQVQGWMNAWVALALLALVAGRGRTAGALLGLTALFKPHWGLVLVWAAARRRTDVATGFAATAGLGVGVSVLAFGVAAHLNYLDVLRFLGRHGEAYWHNQSFVGLLCRATDTGSVLTIAHGVFPPYVPGLHLAGLAFAALVLGLALGLPARRPAAGGPLDLALWLLALTLASPVAWHYHYGPLLAILALMVAAALRAPGRGNWRMAALAAIYLAAGTFWRGTASLVGTWGAGLISIGFFGAVAAYVVLLDLVWREIPSDGEAAT